MRPPCLLLSVFLASCGSDDVAFSSEVKLSFVSFPIRSTTFAPLWITGEGVPRPAEYYFLVAADYPDSCAADGPSAAARATIAVERSDGKALVAGDRCARGVAPGTGHCSGIVEIERRDADGARSTWRGSSGSVHIVAVEEDRLELEVEAKVHRSGTRCEGLDMCTCTVAPLDRADCWDGPTESLRLRLESKLCREKCICDVEGADACTCR